MRTGEHRSCRELIAALSDGELSKRHQHLVQEHLRGCLRCQREMFVQWDVAHALARDPARAPAALRRRLERADR